MTETESPDTPHQPEQFRCQAKAPYAPTATLADQCKNPHHNWPVSPSFGPEPIMPPNWRYKGREIG